jgi:hypothetical protein
MPLDDRLLSPSNLLRRELCPGSLTRERQHPEQTSADAERGTDLHALVSQLLTAQGPTLDAAISRLGDLEDWDSYSVDFCVQFVQGILARHPQAQAQSECRLDLTHIHPEFVGGTPDLVIVEPCIWGMVLDFKFGRKAVATPGENLQLSAYALGVAMKYAIPADCMEMVVVQPPNSFPGRLDAQAEARIRAVVEGCLAPDADVVPGEEQCRYCRASGSCPEQLAATQAVALGAPAPEAVSVVALIEWLAEVERLDVEGTIGKAKQRLYGWLLAGNTDPSGRFLLTPGKVSRAWAEGALEKLTALAPTLKRNVAALMQPPQPSSPAQLEKAWGKNKPVAEALASVITKKPGALVLKYTGAAPPSPKEEEAKDGTPQ